jgi:hypothetical protein
MGHEIFIVALIYLKRVLTKFDLTNSSYLKGMYSSCVLLAHKYLMDDEYWPIDEFSQLVKIMAKQLIPWEQQIVGCLDYRLYVTTIEYSSLKTVLLE